ncbi:MAG: helix-turn-helix domain-containing protein [Chloroflexi bacterium]|nr:MAG: helix-turn-helix domain-containing protein [Chloroflexota bacterium]
MITRYRVRCPSVPKRQDKAAWDASTVLALRRHMKLSQEGLAAELGTRQQTVSEWETGRYRPRGASATLLAIIAERAEFEYGTGSAKPASRESRK